MSAVTNTSDFVMERFGKGQEMDRSFDIEFWQRLSDEQRMAAVWDLVILDCELIQSLVINAAVGMPWAPFFEKDQVLPIVIHLVR